MEVCRWCRAERLGRCDLRGCTQSNGSDVMARGRCVVAFVVDALGVDNGDYMIGLYRVIILNNTMAFTRFYRRGTGLMMTVSVHDAIFTSDSIESSE
uniref:Uncharacterized protein n=1 Tax=Plectus sambesii TaxID=2011161 RepID=A0A914VQ12_9BILA